MDCFVASAPRNDVDGQESAISRRNPPEVFPKVSRLEEIRGRRECRALNAPAASCVKKQTHELVTTVTPEQPGIPRAMVYGLFRALPGDHACLTPSPALLLADLTPTIGASERHDFAVRVGTVRHTRRRVHRIPPHVRNVRNAPLRDGTVRDIEVICPRRQA